jgi:4'-phosphopantetheinyl transferase
MIDVLWLEQTSSDLPAHDDWLTPRETACLAGLRFPKRRADWRLGRWTAKQAVAAYLETDSADIEIFGPAAPTCRCLAGPTPAPAISITHSQGRAACVVAPASITIGCDLEMIEPRSTAFLSDYFTENERRVIASDPPALGTLFWSAKESALKALLAGLTLDTRQVEVTADLAAGTIWVSAPEGRCFRGWWWISDDFMRTVVTDATGARLRMHELSPAHTALRE